MHCTIKINLASLSRMYFEAEKHRGSIIRKIQPESEGKIQAVCPSLIFHYRVKTQLIEN